jgi:hypothetical protein
MIVRESSYHICTVMYHENFYHASGQKSINACNCNVKKQKKGLRLGLFRHKINFFDGNYYIKYCLGKISTIYFFRF